MNLRVFDRISDLDKEAEMLTMCALGFDGYKYMETTGYNPDRALRRVLRSGNLPDALAEQFCLFFFLQRSFFKTGGDALPQQSREWNLFRTLFLALKKKEVPPGFTMNPETFRNRWTELTSQQIDALAYELYGLNEEEIKIGEGAFEKSV